MHSRTSIKVNEKFSKLPSFSAQITMSNQLKTKQNMRVQFGKSRTKVNSMPVDKNTPLQKIQKDEKLNKEYSNWP